MLWVKAFHIIAVICWFAALFYLPRLFVYHSMSEDTLSRQRFHLMESKLYRIIATPAMLATLALGLWLTWMHWSAYSHSLWFWAKIILVLALIAYQHVCKRIIRLLAEDKSTYSTTFFRWFNEFPVLCLVPIVILVVVKPG